MENYLGGKKVIQIIPAPVGMTVMQRYSSGNKGRAKVVCLALVEVDTDRTPRFEQEIIPMVDCGGYVWLQDAVCIDIEMDLVAGGAEIYTEKQGSNTGEDES